jgi:hypothetical protein
MMTIARTLGTLSLTWVIAACELLGCGGKSAPACGAVDAPLTPALRAELQDDLQISLPESVSTVSFHRENGIDTGVWLRMTLPCDEALALQRQLGLADDKLAAGSEVRQLQAALACPWWRPAAGPNARAGTAERSRGGSSTFTTLGVTPAGQSACDVYVFHFDT